RGGELPARFRVSGADVHVRERRAAAEMLARRDERVAEIADDEMLRRRDAGGVRRHVSIEDVDRALRQKLAQMVVGAAVAETELERRTGQVGDELRGAVEAGALRLEAPYGAVETAHVVRDSASRSRWFVLSSRFASSRMVAIAICGNSVTIRMNSSLAMRSATTRPLARTVAVRGTSHRIAISPTKAFLPSVATTAGPPAVSTRTSASPSMMM